MRRELQYQVDTEDRLPDALAWAGELAAKGLAAGPIVVSLGRPRRTLDQNSKLWPMLHDVASQVHWHGEKLTPEEWKDLFTAALRGQKAVQGINGGVVLIGAHTSRMRKGEFSELIEFIYSFGAEQGVEWSEPSEQAMAKHREAA